MPSPSFHRRFIVLCTLLLALSVWVWWRNREPAPAPPSESESGATASSPSARDHIAPKSAATSPQGSIALVATSEQARTVADNSRPGRMMFLDFKVTRGGFTLVRVTGAAGRAKPLQAHYGPAALFYDVFSADGQLVLSGAVADPLRQRYEYEDEHVAGKIRSTIIASDEGEIALRLPGEAVPARVVFYREESALDGQTATRNVFADIRLRPDLP